MAIEVRFALSASFVLSLALFAEYRARVRARALAVPLRAPSSTRRVIAASLALSAALLSSYGLAASLGLLALVPLSLWPRSLRAVSRSTAGHFTPLALPPEGRAQRGCASGSLLDATTLRGGLVLLLALYALTQLPGAFDLAGEPYGLALACALPSWFIGARAAWPRSIDEQIDALRRALCESALSGCAFRLLAFVDECAALSEPRARITHEGRYPGLVRVDVLVDTRRSRPPFVLCAVVQSGSLCERWIGSLGARVARVEGALGGRVALLWSVAEFDVGVAGLFALLDRESQQTIERIVSAQLQPA